MSRESLKKFFTDTNGDWAVIQFPNALLYFWLVLTLVAFLPLPGSVLTGLQNASGAVIFTWAYLEITQGDSTFRRCLGVVVITCVVYSYFH